MMGRLEGKRAFLTAAGAGIGRATAIAMAKAGAHVIATDIQASSLEDLKDHGIAETKRLDVRDALAVNAIARDLDAIDILFNGAGFVHAGTILETSEKDWDFSFDLNVASMHRTISAFLPGMIDGPGGAIINVASVAGMKGIVNRYAYGATKAAVIGLTKSVAADFVSKGIRCNAICPGTVDTPSLGERISEQAQASSQTTDAVRAAFVGRQPMGRLGTADEVAAMAVYLATDDAQFITGAALPIDGGMTI
ncbi:MAG: SDR family oxidoreductase [Pseudomonadota bacterium]